MRAQARRGRRPRHQHRPSHTHAEGVNPPWFPPSDSNCTLTHSHPLVCPDCHFDSIAIPHLPSSSVSYSSRSHSHRPPFSPPSTRPTALVLLLLAAACGKHAAVLPGARCLGHTDPQRLKPCSARKNRTPPARSPSIFRKATRRIRHSIDVHFTGVQGRSRNCSLYPSPSTTEPA